jgi:xanthine/CO dehydrogenase XdhC/CoxF family maturation factor
MSLILRKLTELEARGTAVEALDRMRCPIGLDVGGKAISIAAELLGVHHGRVATPAR